MAYITLPLYILCSNIVKVGHCEIQNVIYNGASNSLHAYRGKCVYCPWLTFCTSQNPREILK